jgi:CRP/FNR family transcriptional regulator, cyclic AMP receptor protein
MAGNSPNKLGMEIWQALVPITAVRVFPKGARLFQQGRPAEGIYVVEQGEVRVFLSSQKPAKIFEIAGPGAVLGLSESVSGRDYKVTAEAADQTKVSYIERQQLMAFLRDHCDICMEIVRLLSEDLHALYHRFRVLNGATARGRKKSTRNVN